MGICLDQLVALDLHNDAIGNHLEQGFVQRLACAELVLVEAGHAHHANLQIVARNDTMLAHCIWNLVGRWHSLGQELLHNVPQLALPRWEGNQSDLSNKCALLMPSSA